MKTKIIKSNGKSGIATLVLPSRSEHCVTVCGDNAILMNNIIRDLVGERDAVTLSRFVFAGRAHYRNFKNNISSSDGIFDWLQGDACGDGEISAMQSFAVSRTKATPIKVNGHLTGYFFDDEFARYCRLSGLVPKDINSTREAQAREVFDLMAASLDQCGMCFTDTVRTWFYIDRLLEWYKGFNAVRMKFFQENKVFEKTIPASTGIGAGNALGTALIADLIAVKPKSDQVRIQSVPSPMQCSALDYRSSFSRAVEMSFPTHRTLLLSGTASIGPDGQSVFIGDCVKQIGLTMQVVEALLKSRDMGWMDLFRGIAYFKDMSDRKFLDQYCKDHGIPEFPIAVAHADICRGDLLFEIEADAVKVDS